MMRSIAFVLLCCLVILAKAQPGSFERFLNTLLSCGERTLQEPHVFTSHCAGLRYEKVTFVSSDSLPGRASAVMVTRSDSVVAALVCSRGKRYTVFKSDLPGEGSPSLVRSNSSTGIVEHAEFPLDGTRDLIVEDRDHDKHLDNVQIPMGADQFSVLQFDTLGRAIRFLIYDNRAAEYRISAELAMRSGIPGSRSFSYYAENEWVEFIFGAEGPRIGAAAKIYRMDGQKMVSTNLVNSANKQLIAANARRNELATWLRDLLAQSWSIWLANRDTVAKSGVIGYRFPLLVAVP